MNNSVISVDLAKNVFQVCALNKNHKPVFNKKVNRSKLLDTLRNLEANQVVMEACYSSNYWGREIEKLGFTVGLIPPHQVKPFVVGNKNDHNDAIAIAEASFRPRTTFVPVKTLTQQDIQSLHRIRERYIKARTSIANQLRGLLAEYGIIVKKNIGMLRKNIPCILEDPENALTATARQFIAELYEELQYYDDLIGRKEIAIKTLLKDNADYQRLLEVPGIGPIVGSAVIASVGNAKQFKNGRQMAAWIGLTPKQYASGDISRISGISKRGNQTLRRLFIHGARAIVNWCEKKNDALSLWIKSLLKTKHPCKVVVAVANKLARMTWAVLAKNEHYMAPSLTTAG